MTDKGKRSSSFLDKFNTFGIRVKDKSKHHGAKADRPAYRPPSDASEYGDVSSFLEVQKAFQSMPEEEVLRKFEQMLDDMNLTEEKKKPLRERKLEQKRTMLAMQYRGSRQPKGQVDSPAEFITRLENPELRGEKRHELISSLRVALTSNPVSWVQEFGTKGLNAILRNLTYCTDSKSKKKKVPTATLR